MKKKQKRLINWITYLLFLMLLVSACDSHKLDLVAGEFSQNKIVCSNTLLIDNGRFDIKFCNDQNWKLSSENLNDSTVMGGLFVQGWVVQDIKNKLLLNCSFKEFAELDFETISPILIHRNDSLMSEKVVLVDDQNVYIQKSQFEQNDNQYYHLMSWVEIDTLALMKFDFYSEKLDGKQLKEMEEFLLSFEIVNVKPDSLIEYVTW